jgi:hypothetical protein
LRFGHRRKLEDGKDIAIRLFFDEDDCKRYIEQVVGDSIDG